jgi:hypothetical protein
MNSRKTRTCTTHAALCNVVLLARMYTSKQLLTVSNQVSSSSASITMYLTGCSLECHTNSSLCFCVSKRGITLLCRLHASSTNIAALVQCSKQETALRSQPQVLARAHEGKWHFAQIESSLAAHLVTRHLSSSTTFASPFTQRETPRLIYCTLVLRLDALTFGSERERALMAPSRNVGSPPPPPKP